MTFDVVVEVRLRPGIADPQGATIERALPALGFEGVSGGAILLDGQRINDLPTHKRNMGVVFQNYALFPHMPVSRNVAFPLEMRGIAKAEVADRVKKALDMVQLGHLADRLPGQVRSALSAMQHGDWRAAEQALPGAFAPLLPGPGHAPRSPRHRMLLLAVVGALVGTALAVWLQS